MTGAIETITQAERVIAIIVRASFREQGVHFFTPDEFSQQLAFMSHPAGKTIEPHVHNRVEREVTLTQEVLVIKRGLLRVDFYLPDRRYQESRLLAAGDVILLAGGGHGFEVIEDVEMLEVKQGPYTGDADKTRFEGVTTAEVHIGPLNE